MNYVDTSFIALPLLGQTGATQANEFLRGLMGQGGLISSALLRIELFRLARRTGTDVHLVHDVLSEVNLVDIDDNVIERACTLTGELKSLDAIHLATALLLNDPSDPITVLTHDVRLAAAARAHSLSVVDLLD